MKRLLCLLLLMFVMSPLLVMAEDEAKPENSDAAVKTKAMIGSRVFMESGGVEKMKAVSSGLSEEWREAQYVQNKKIRALGWLSLLVPSLGNWIVGDKVGGVVSVVGTAGGFTLYFVGYGMLIGAAYNYRGSSYSFDYSGAIVLGVGVVAMIGFGVYSIVSALSYAGTYNDNLRDALGLELVYNDPVEMGRKAMAEAVNLPKPAPELIHMNLLSVSF